MVQVNAVGPFCNFKAIFPKPLSLYPLNCLSCPLKPSKPAITCPAATFLKDLYELLLENLSNT